ncbi:response regulator [Desulfococcaceae bacterium HSG9]|nr:response regulator [Desulfococcaceae bacterium HSG9]
MKKKGYSQVRRQAVLIVDGMPENVTSLTEYLGSDYNLKMVINGSDAISQIIMPDFIPALILLNTTMPDIDGYTILKEFKINALTKNIPIILISSNADSDEQARGIALGAADYLITPFQRATVKARIDVYMEINRQRAIIEKAERHIQKIERHADYIASEKENELIELNRIFSSIGDGICVISKDFKILRINANFSKIHEKNENIIGKDCYDIFKSSRCHTSRCPLVLISKGEERVEFDITLNFGKNSRKLYLLTARGYHDSQRNFRGIVQDLRDITDLRQTEKQQLHREKIQVVLEVIGAVCHELIQPMQIISMCAQLILIHKNGDTNENHENDYYTKVKTINEQIERMKTITEKLKRITRYETIDYVDGIKIVDLDKASSQPQSDSENSDLNLKRIKQ